MITLDHLQKGFGGRQVLKGVDLQVKRGETLVIIGGSGSGKSVLMKHVIGLLFADSGQVRIDGDDLAQLKEPELTRTRRRFGMVFQNAALFDSMNVWQNVGFALMQHTKKRKKAVLEIAQHYLEMVGLPDVLYRMPSELSGGMRKRVGLARAIATSPEILLYDEPTTGLDPVTSDVINRLIRSLQEQLGITSLMITHDMVSAYHVADRMAMLYQGKIIETGTPEQIRATDNPYVRQFISGSSDGPIEAG